ncbi:MAG TPA: LptA/OstA family protein [Caulobacteraceae bacterium]|jgi:lipopolysaccharide export system protein LptA|nr:LptA/OstA family protein [Caulobacteraceae bacterium]
MKRWTASVCAVAALAGFGGAALAQPQAGVVDSNAPIDITANEAEVIQSKCVAIWRGAAEALQGKTRLRANTITVYSRPKAAQANGQPACGGTDRIEADGQVYYVTPQQNARGDHAVYSQSADQIVITGDVVVVQGDNVARGDRLVIKVSTREAKMESNVKGAGRQGRVRGVFYPSQGDQNAATPKP